MGVRHVELEAARIRKNLKRAGRSTLDAAWLAPSLRRALPYTMIRASTLLRLGQVVRHTLASEIPGAFVECGVWRGGASFLMADVLRREHVTDRVVWMFDSFEGMPPVEAIDGKRALQWEEQGDPATNDATASLEEVEAAREKLGLSALTRPVKGWFEKTLPETREEIGPIALLRLDCDWHASVTTCLETLYNLVSPGGYVLIDDYYTFDGCALAVHEFLGRRQLAHPITTDQSTAYFRK
jgi:O-methyltransferase